MIIYWVSSIFLGLGIVLGITGAVGLLRFPDFYTRVHAASVTDTLCTACFVIGLCLQAGLTLITVKLLIVLILLWMTGPASGHALVKAAFTAGLKPKAETIED